MSNNHLQAFYRLQMNKDFQFEDLIQNLPYFKKLGISHLYLSPVFLSRSSSIHGYDCIDMNIINPELGGENKFYLFCQKARKLDLKIILDIVPNHRAFSNDNHFIMDLLEKGRKSPYAYLFDINWQSPYSYLNNRLMVPFLGDNFASCLLNGEFKLIYKEKKLFIQYYDWLFPVRIESYRQILDFNLRHLISNYGKNHNEVIKLQAIILFLSKINLEEEEKLDFDFHFFIREMLSELYFSSNMVKKHIEDNINYFNGQIGEKESFNSLASLIKEQHYVLSYWKTGNEEINYRRFFTINELSCLKVEEDEVFLKTQHLIINLLKEDIIQGVRIDHIDGLKKPLAYLKKLKQIAPDSLIFVEKILHLNENLRSLWPVQGTTGYDFMTYISQFFCNKNMAKHCQRSYAGFIIKDINYKTIEHESKRLMIDTRMVGDIDNLAFLLKDIASKKRYGMDLTMHALKRALVEILVHFPVYRTYITMENCEEQDRHIIEQVVTTCKKKYPHYLKEFELIKMAFLSHFDDSQSQEEKNNWLNFTLRFQQYSGAVMAKSVEDTTFYLFSRLIALNEVGNDPSQIGIDNSKFNHFINYRLNKWPQALNATSTHDTKRGEDSRARLCVISENPKEFLGYAKLWSKLNEIHKTVINDELFPDKNFEYFIYQSLIGSWPFDDLVKNNFYQRIEDYLIKAARESKKYTSWLFPNEDYENALSVFIRKILDDSEGNVFLRSFIPYNKKIMSYGVINSLVQIVFKILLPGTPDFYQGSELWNLSFADPDNRNNINYKIRRELLNDVISWSEAITSENVNLKIINNEDNIVNGKIKLFFIHKLLNLRERSKDFLFDSTWETLKIEGNLKNHFYAFNYHKEEKKLIVIVPRFLSQIIKDYEFIYNLSKWKELSADLLKSTTIFISKGKYQNFLTQKEKTFNQTKVNLNDILDDFPIGILYNY